MEEGMGSVDRGSDVIKKKSSSGCLIIKKKGNGLLGFGGLDSKKVFESNNEKKRSRIVGTDSGSSDEAEPVRRKVREDIIYERRRNVHNVEDTRITSFGSERKRSGLDVFEFDEYDDGFDGKRMKKDYMDDGLELAGRSGNHRGINIRSSGDFDKRKQTNYERKGSVSGGRSKGINNSGKRRYKAEKEDDDDDDDESHLPISYLREKCREAPVEPIRLQGKNGVLKVMVNKKKQNFSLKVSDHSRSDERSSRSEAAVKKNEMIRPSFYSDSKRPAKTVSRKREKSYLKARETSPVLSSKSEDSDTDDSEKSLKQETKAEQSQRSKKAINNEHKRTTPTEISTPPTGVKESKVKRGNGTEKQLLREKIRSMLLDRGWRIDYRPRRNRDYLDAVYINPAGTAYWSIIKAYDAFQKQLEEDEDNIKTCGESTSFSPLPEEIISKLTRQTRKKIERELKKKKREASCIRSAKEVTVRESANCSDSEQQDEKLSFYMKSKNKKGRMHKTDNVSGDDLSDSSHKEKPKLDMAEKQSATKSHMIQGRKSGKIGRCTLLVRSSDKGLNSETDGYVPYNGKRTILSWLIDSEVVNMSEKVQYMNCRKTKVLLKGWITKDGIHCGCCSKILSISKFEIHAGSKQRQPFLNIYLESGLSLMQCQIDAWNKQEESKREGYHHINVDGDDPNDDACGLCGDGGDLMCCDSCPSTFHQSCLDIKMIPAGDWHCPNCTCKFCGLAGWSNAKANDGTDNSLLLCNLCEKKYHQSCCQDVVDLTINPGDATSHFCGKTCQEIYSHLQKLLGVKHELGSGFSWSIVHRIDQASESLHLGYSQRVECNSKLAVALSVMDECFLPIVDRRSRINLIHSVLYNCGSNFTRLNFSGFYTAILERGDEIVAAASIRIHGTQLAEMPFIGTRHIYRRQGMCRRLLSAVELALSILKVEKLIIPAIAEHLNTWTEKFNFSPLEESHKQEMTSMNMLVFPGTDMLQKLVVKREITEENTTKNSGVKFEQDSSPERELNMSDSSELQPLTECDKKSSDLIFASQVLTVPSNDISAVSSSLIFSCEPATEQTIAVNSIYAESTVSCGSTSPNENTCNFLAEKAVVVGQLVKDHTQPYSNDFITVKESTTEASMKLVGDVAKIEEEASVVQNSVSVRDSVSHGTSESTRIDSDMCNHTAVELDDACEVHDNGIIVNSNKHSVEELSAKDIVEDQNLSEKSAGNMKEDAAAVQNSVSVHDLVSHGTFESTHIDSDMTSHTAVDLDETCEVDVTDTFVNFLKDPVEQFSAEDTVKDNVTRIRTVPECNGDNVLDHAHDVELNDACVEPLVDTYIDSDMTNHTAVDLDRTCEVDVPDTSANYCKDSVEQLSAEDTAKEDIAGIRTVPECNGDNMADNTHDVELNDACVKPLVDTYIDSDVTNHTAVDLDKTCEVHVTDTFVNSPKDSVEQLSAEDTVKEDVTKIKTVPECIRANVVDNTHDVELNDACVRSLVDTYIDSDMTDCTAVDLDKTCEVHVTDTFVDSPKDSVEQLSAEDTVKEDVTEIKTVPECIGDKVVDNTHEVELNDVCVEPLLDTHIDCDTTNYTAVDLDKTCEVDVNHIFVNSPKDSVEQLSAEDTFKKGVTETRTIPECNGDNVVDEPREVKVNDACVESVVDPFNKSLALNNASQAMGKDLTESSSATDMMVDERNGDSNISDKGSDLGDAQEVDVKVASNNSNSGAYTCQVLNENVTGSTSDKKNKDVNTDFVYK